MDTSTPNIWQLQARRDVSGLIDALAHTDEGVRKRAATALRTLDAAEALPALEAALAVEEGWQAQASISAAIQYLRREDRLEDLIAQENVEELIAALHSPDEAEVILAARALGRFGDMRASEALITLFRRPDISDDVRYVAAQALIALKSPPTVVSLIAGLRRSEWQVRRNSAAILGQLGATWAAPALADALRDEHPLVQQTAEAALRRFNTPAARGYLNEWHVQQRALRARQQVAPQPPPPAAPAIGSAPPAEAPSIVGESPEVVADVPDRVRAPDNTDVSRNDADISSDVGTSSDVGAPNGADASDSAPAPIPETPASVKERPVAEAPALGDMVASNEAVASDKADALAAEVGSTQPSRPTALLRPDAAAPDDASPLPTVEEPDTAAQQTGDQ